MCIICQADDSMKGQDLFSVKNKQKYLNMLSAAVEIGMLRVNGSILI